jgi:hypothetical protein
MRSTLSGLALIAALPAAAADYIVAVPETLARDQARQVHKDLLDLVLETAAPGDVIRVVDATALDTIATFAIPEGSEARVANLRRRALAGALDAWGRFIRAHYVDAAGTDPDRQGQILLPQLLTHLATQTYAGHPAEGREICVLVLGSALHRDPREPGFDMTAGRFPADGLILASQSQSPYGTADRQGQLRGFYVHMLAFDRTWASDLYALRVQRAWTLFVEAQGGALATFTTDPATARARFATCERKPGRRFAWDSTQSLQAMITAERLASIANASPEPTPEPDSEVPDAPVPAPAPAEPVGPAATVPDVVISNDDWLKSETVVVSNSPPALTRANLKLGIRWGDDGRCANSDLDLYVRSDPARPYLFFGNLTSPDGRFDKDHRSAPEVRNGLEHVDITDQVALASIDILVNLYEGTCRGGPKGVIRAYVDGIAYEMAFHISAERGDRGRSPLAGPNWIRIDPRALFNLD